MLTDAKLIQSHVTWHSSFFGTSTELKRLLNSINKKIGIINFLLALWKFLLLPSTNFRELLEERCQTVYHLIIGVKKINAEKISNFHFVLKSIHNYRHFPLLSSELKDLGKS